MKYEQGWKQNSGRQFRFPRSRKQLKEDVAAAAELLMLAVVVGIVMFSLFGCAGAQTLAQTPVYGSGAVSGHVRLQAMGDCVDQIKTIHKFLRSYLEVNGVPRPNSILLLPAPGSSLCGHAQGTTSEVSLLELGARYRAEAQVTLDWDVISQNDLAKAQRLIYEMRPQPTKN